MQSKRCLFYHKNSNCNSIASDEHIIQQGLAGTLSSSDLICENCNNYFSRDIDTQLVALYEPIINILNPLLPGKLKRKKKKAQLITGEGEQCDIEYLGGSVSLSKINKSYSSNGQLGKIVAPGSIPLDNLKGIVHKMGAKVESERTMLITEYFSETRQAISADINSNLIRAILLDILELAHYVSIKETRISIAKHEALSDLRVWIRSDLHSNCPSIKRIFYSFAPISDILDSLFDASTFSHRIVVCYNRKSKVLILVAQFLNTMPWLFCLEDITNHPHSETILYQKALLDGEDYLHRVNRVVLNSKEIQWRTLSTNTRCACEFAQTKFIQEFKRQFARAHYESDLRNSAFIRDRLAYYTEKSNDANKSIHAIVELMENRYQASEYLASILSVTRDKATERWDSNVDHESQRVSLYQECLRIVANKYGYPVLSDN